MMTPQPKRIRWSRFGRDLFVIILGVLVALAFDNFTSARKDHRLEREYLTRIRRDLRADSAMLADYLVIARRGERASADLLRYLADQQSVPDTLIARDLSDATRGAYLTPNKPTFAEITGTGKAHLIRSDELRDALFNYYASVERFQRSLETVMKRGKDPLGELGWDLHAYDAALGYSVNLGRAPEPLKNGGPDVPSDSVPLITRFRRAPNAMVATRRALTYNSMLQPIVGEWYQSLDAVRRKMRE